MSSTGGKFVWKDDQETPNTQQCTFDYGDAQMTFDVRNLPTPPEALVELKGPNYVGNIFFGEGGFLTVDHAGFQVYKSTAGVVSGEAARGAGAGSREKYEKAMDEKSVEAQSDATTPHMKNFFEAIRARDYKLLHADVEIGVRSANHCHLANISYRVGRTLRIAQSSGHFLGDSEATSLLTRNYRAPYAVPESV